MDASRTLLALKLCLVIAAALALGATMPAAQTSAGSAVVAIGSATASVGEEVSMDLQALGVPEPGLGAWTVDVTYDGSMLSITGCQSEEGSVCLLSFGPDTNRITGASATGLLGDTTLATMTYRCETPGVSPLELDASMFGDATTAVPQDIDYTVVNGSITCVVPSAPTPTDQGGPTATALPLLPATGSGPESGGSAGWVIAVLAGVSLAALASLGALRLRARPRS